MKAIRLLFIYAISLAMCWCCSDDKKEEPVPPVLEVSQESFRVSNDSVSILLEITSNGDWVLTGDDDWYKFSSASGTGDAVVNIAVRSNLGSMLRKGYLFVRGQGIEKKIVLTQAALSLEIKDAEYTAKSAGEEFEVKVFCNGHWMVGNDSAWIHVNPVSGNDTGSFRVRLDPNGLVNRTAKIYVKAGTIARYINIKQEGEQGGWHAEGEVRLYRQEDAGNPVKMAFMGDGFVEEELVIGGAYDQVMEEAIEAYFAVEPYKTYRNYFCPYIVYAYSEEKGASTRGTNGNIEKRKKTAFSVDIKSGETLMNGNMDKILRYARKVEGMKTEEAAIVVISSDSRYAGTCYQWENGQTVALLPMNRDSRPPGGLQHLVAHEAGGHGFGLLADEYSSHDATLPTSEKNSLENSYRYGMNLNVTASRDPETVFWHEFIGRPGYELVDFFEGAFYYSKGVWRSENRTCMVDNILYYSLACRLAIVKRLKAIAGEAFELDDFIAKDVQKQPSPEQLSTRSLTPYMYPEPTPPILMK